MIDAFVVAEARLERTTSRLWAWRATNCSTPRYNVAHRLFPNCECKGSDFFFILQIFEEKNAVWKVIFLYSRYNKRNFAQNSVVYKEEESAPICDWLTLFWSV